MPIHVNRAERGFTLVEFMVAILILTVGLFALLTSINVAMKQNMSNKIRNDAVVLAEQFLVNNRSVPYANLANSTVPRDILTGAVRMRYTIITTVAPIPNTNSSGVSVEVRWLERGDTGVADGQIFHAHSVSTLVTNTLAN